MTGKAGNAAANDGLTRIDMANPIQMYVQESQRRFKHLQADAGSRLRQIVWASGGSMETLSTPIANDAAADPTNASSVQQMRQPDVPSRSHILQQLIAALTNPDNSSQQDRFIDRASIAVHEAHVLLFGSQFADRSIRTPVHEVLLQMVPKVEKVSQELASFMVTFGIILARRAMQHLPGVAPAFEYLDGMVTSRERQLHSVVEFSGAKRFPDGHVFGLLMKTHGSACLPDSDTGENCVTMLLTEAGSRDPKSKFEKDFRKACKMAAVEFMKESRMIQFEKKGSEEGKADGEALISYQQRPLPPKYLTLVDADQVKLYAMEPISSSFYVVYPVHACKVLPMTSQDMTAYDGMISAYMAVYLDYCYWAIVWKPVFGPSGVSQTTGAHFTDKKKKDKINAGGIVGSGSAASGSHGAALGTFGTSALVGGSSSRLADQMTPTRKSRTIDDIRLDPVHFEPTPLVSSLQCLEEQLGQLYRTNDEIFRSDHRQTRVFRAVRRMDNMNVVLKMCEARVAFFENQAHLVLANAVAAAAAERGDSDSSPSIRANSDTTIASSFVAPLLAVHAIGWGGSAEGLQHVLVFPQLQGLDESALLQTSPGVTQWFWRYAVELCDAVCFLHSLDIAHRDLKPANLMMESRNGQLRLIDLELSLWPASKSSHVIPAGSPQWMPLYPHAATGLRYDPLADDVFGVGAIILQFLLYGLGPAECLDEPVCRQGYDCDDADELLPESWAENHSWWLGSVRKVLRQMMHDDSRQRPSIFQAAQMLRIAHVAYQSGPSSAPIPGLQALDGEVFNAGPVQIDTPNENIGPSSGLSVCLRQDKPSTAVLSSQAQPVTIFRARDEQ